MHEQRHGALSEMHDASANGLTFGPWLREHRTVLYYKCVIMIFHNSRVEVV